MIVIIIFLDRKCIFYNENKPLKSKYIHSVSIDKIETNKKTPGII